MPKQNWAEAPVPQADEEHVAPLLESLSWARIYAGTREALIAAGLVMEGQFPGDPGRAKRTQHYYGPPCWRIERRGRNWFSVRLPRSMPSSGSAMSNDAVTGNGSPLEAIAKTTS